MSVENQYCLAMYDIRSKQQYIFRKDKIKEIVGGSAIIRDCFKDYLLNAADEYAEANNFKHGLFNDKEHAFNREKFINRVDSNTNVGEVIYDGGGNFYCIYKDKRTCENINRIFSKNLLKDTQTLKVLCSIKESINFDNYKADQDELRKIHDKLEACSAPVLPSQVLPFTQVDASTSLPVYGAMKIAGEDIQVTRESYMKYLKFEEERPKYKDNELVLDKIADDKDDSLLAVIFIDGNSMGTKVSEIVKDGSSYEDAIKNLRNFSKEINEDYIINRINDINEYLNGQKEKRKRFIVSAGDETSFICKAEDALEIVKVYLDGLKQEKGQSSCAGICIFHSHSPYAEAYRIAEECCESGKKLMKKAGLTNACLIDFHYCQSGFGIDLETIRNKEIGNIISKPWLYKIGKDEKINVSLDTVYTDFDKVNKMSKELNKISRTNIKSLLDSARNSEADFEKELNRIIAHTDKKLNLDFDKVESDRNKKRSLIYDIVTVYDLWFKEEC